MSDVPNGRAIVLTFDNLGEASALQRGTWDPHTPLGSDPSVTQALPWLLDALDRSRLRATFFVEAINCELNPEALRTIRARGHELGVHGWEHEVWGELDADTERELLQRSARAFAALGLDAAGFRPPGGRLTEHTPALLRELGFTWCSPAVDAESPAPALARESHGLAVVPFDWELVDAYHLMERFADLRERRGDSPTPLDARAAAARMTAALQQDVQHDATRSSCWTRLGANACSDSWICARTSARPCPGVPSPRSRVGP
jgi:peptidoglycan/xylan/chitin deacetylase (PgdA/CDA1 family)